MKNLKVVKKTRTNKKVLLQLRTDIFTDAMNFVYSHLL
jgi:hypothetical protein